MVVGALVKGTRSLTSITELVGGCDAKNQGICEVDPSARLPLRDVEREELAWGWELQGCRV
jgi:hypothetical protein